MVTLDERTVLNIQAKARKQSVTFAVEPDLLEQLDKSAKLLNTPRSHLLNQIIKDHYNRMNGVA